MWLWLVGMPALAAENEPECPTLGVTLPSNVTPDAPSCGERTDAPPPQVAAGIAQVAGAWKAATGADLPPGHVGWTDWGYVSLPMQRFLTLEEREAVQKAERMLTDEQREKATSALGPELDGGVVYTHFLGADARFTDLWGKPHTVASLITLASGWYRHCVVELAKQPELKADPANCTLQIGDIAYFGPQQPDPLGHYDHYRGECTDLRLFRTDGSRYEAWIDREDDREGFGRAYNGPLTKAFVAYAVEHAQLGDVYFNDPAVHEAFDAVVPKRKHDDHIHLCFAPPAPGP